MLKALSLLLLLSLLANCYLLFKIQQLSPNQQQPNQKQIETLVKQNKNGQSPALSAQNPFSTPAVSSSNNNDTTSEDLTRLNEVPESLSTNDLFSMLKELQAAQRYNDMILPVREYLKLNPNDYRAWLIEADIIFHTEALNVAIAYYYSLLDKTMPDSEKSKIRSLINVNASRVIKQLSGDGAWELLATFLEPLIQIDPLNKRYILALARAYGQQEQLVLMENVLAAMDYDDEKAQKLRTAMYNRAKGIESGEDDLIDDPISETASLSKRKIKVSGNGEQFFVSARFGRRTYPLLLDTGASTTAIKQSVFEKVADSGKEFVGYFTVQTAGGAIQAPLYKLESIQLDRLELTNVSVIVLPNENLKGSFSGLLGMNVLRAFEMRFDPSTQKMTLFER
ncbi:clan AA aspartic protease [Glaciecola sp. MH2013]|uniref:retropepsin-like aspartic protease family protein n=1 Tax=Glaciecola sp. MH2013 TaxID=2785524 RepID=UPI0018A103F5|nr:retropepsin-like aspartic protease [Glaciecola sp. MH2013]MBF7072513.1 clan AA aspartic protease [Glaciecola sp. MH2013]